jgi:hypothetical protein
MGVERAGVLPPLWAQTKHTRYLWIFWDEGKRDLCRSRAVQIFDMDREGEMHMLRDDHVMRLPANICIRFNALSSAGGKVLVVRRLLFCTFAKRAATEFVGLDRK